MTNVNAILLNVANSNLYTFNGETAITTDAEDFDTVTWELEGYIPCEYCGEYHSEDETTYIENYGYVCRNCLADNFAICEQCGDWFPNEQLQTVIDAEGNELLVCRNCAEELNRAFDDDARINYYMHCVSGYRTCAHCGKKHLREDVRYFWGFGFICKDCLNIFFTAGDSDSALIKG